MCEDDEWQWQTLVLMWFQLKQNTLNPVTDSVFDIVLKDVFAPQDLLLNRIVWVMDTKYLLLWRNGKRHKCLWPREPVAPPETEDPAGEELGKRGVDLSACVLCPPLQPVSPAPSRHMQATVNAPSVLCTAPATTRPPPSVTVTKASTGPSKTPPAWLAQVRKFWILILLCVCVCAADMHFFQWWNWAQVVSLFCR